MVELRHRVIATPELTQFVSAHPSLTAQDFDSLSFHPVKAKVKADLHADQGGLCVYCECKLNADQGQVEHIKPKGGPNAHPDLCFTYANYAHSCINAKTCGQQKKNGILPIEPGPGCNENWSLSTDGTIEPVAGLSRAQQHAVRQTRDMLGLNKDANLVDERQRWLKQTLAVLQETPNDIQQFLLQAPYRHILETVF